MSGTTSVTSPMEDNGSHTLPAPVDNMASQSNAKKGLLLVLLALAGFLDVFSISVLLLAIPVLSADIGLEGSKIVWLIGSYELAFSAFLLASGRMSDLYNPKYVFLAGITPLGLLAIGMGFVRNAIALLVLRGLSGVAAALTIPSSLYLIVHMFPDPVAQSKAMGVYGAFGSLGSVLGVQIGAVIVRYTSWPWIFWVIAIIALSIAITCAWLIPKQETRFGDVLERTQRLDLVGVTALTLALVLFVFAVTSGSTDGWASANVLVPLFLSLLLIVVFFLWEAKIPEDRAALPPRMWRYQNFTVLTLLSLLPYAWWTTVFLLYSNFWQDVYGWSAITASLHFLPISCFSFLAMFVAGHTQPKFPDKWLLLCGLTLMIISSALFPFADRPSRYWSFLFPAFTIGTFGTGFTYGISNISIFAATPPEVAGIVGAVFNSAQQLGTAVFTAAVTSIQTSVQDSPTSYKGRAAGFWFLFALVTLESLIVTVFLKDVPALEMSSDEDEKIEPSQGKLEALKELPV